VHGRRGFEVLANMFNRCAGLNFQYSSLEDAVGIFAHLAA
jgi:hypothetical protein